MADLRIAGTDPAESKVTQQKCRFAPIPEGRLADSCKRPVKSGFG